MEPFYIRLKRLREKKGLKPIQMAGALGVPASTYRAWEYGKSIQGEPYLRMAEILGVSIVELMSGNPPKTLDVVMQAEAILAQMRVLIDALHALE